MMTQYYQFAGLKLAIAIPEKLYFEEESRLAPFRIGKTVPDLTFRFDIVEELLPPEGQLVCSQNPLQIFSCDGRSIRYLDVFDGDWKKANARVEAQADAVSVQLKKAEFSHRVTVKYVLECLGVEHLAAQSNGFVFHCSYIERDGKAILFTAPSETGKSTQAELWSRLRGARIINGDRAVVRLWEDVLMAEGIPFSGSSQYCENRSLPVEAIVYLGQAPQTTIRKLRGYEAFSRIWEGVTVNTWDKADMEQVTWVVQKAAERIPVYHLPCTPDESAIFALEDALRKQVNP